MTRPALTLLVVVFALTSSACRMTLPGKSFSGTPSSSPPMERVDELKAHVEKLAADIGERNVIYKYDALKRSAEYIESVWRGMGYEVKSQPYTVKVKDGGEGAEVEREVRNLEVELRGAQKPEEIVIIGAHYDSAPGTPGADDNGSGVAMMLALSRHALAAKPSRTLRFVAFVNEEPPFFRRDTMGSRVYAKAARERNDQIVAMVSLETLGYFKDSPGSQHYPFPFSLFYPSVGNFVALIANADSDALLSSVARSFRRTATVASEGAALPTFVPGVDWSDHASFWKYGYEGVMLSDTAPFRNPHYHEPEDTPEKLDYPRLARVLHGMETVMHELANPVTVQRAD
jgi:hypothetical protein